MLHSLHKCSGNISYSLAQLLMFHNSDIWDLWSQIKYYQLYCWKRNHTLSCHSLVYTSDKSSACQCISIIVCSIVSSVLRTKGSQTIKQIYFVHIGFIIHGLQIILISIFPITWNVIPYWAMYTNFKTLMWRLSFGNGRKCSLTNFHLNYWSSDLCVFGQHTHIQTK